jgi:spore germination cell wall hydrolase CwlJ-like protein
MNNLADDLIMLGALGTFFYAAYKWARGRMGGDVPSGNVEIGTPQIVSPSNPFANNLTQPTAPVPHEGGSPAASFAMPAEPPGMDVLARTIWGEARGEGKRGMEAVAAVIMNRVASPRFPDTVEGVCKAPWQFSTWNAGDPNLPRVLSVTASDRNFAIALGIARRALTGKLKDPTGGALHYYANWIEPPNWARGAKVSARIGKHIFLTGVA